MFNIRKIKNNTYLESTSIKNTYQVKQDGTSDGILLAEVNFSTAWERHSLVFAITLVGYTDADESGIYNLGISSSSDASTHCVSYNCMGNASTDRIYTVSSGSNLKVYLKKISTYRTLHATLLGKSVEIDWKITKKG